jgi:ATP-dependent DNA ligase
LGGDAKWSVVKTALSGEIEFAEWMPDGHFRHASLAGLRNDKSREELLAKNKVPSFL